MANCELCGDYILGKKYLSSDLKCMCGKCGSAISLLCFDEVMKPETFDFAAHDFEYYKDLAADMVLPSALIMFNFKTKRIANEVGLFKKKFRVFNFSDVKRIEYESTKKKGVSQEETDKRAKVAGAVTGAVVGAATNGVQGGLMGARVNMMAEAMAGTDWIWVYYDYEGKEQKYGADGSLDYDTFQKICQCFELVRQASEAS